MTLGKEKRQADPGTWPVSQSKYAISHKNLLFRLDVGIFYGLLSASKIMECGGLCGKTSLYYTVQHGESGDMFKSDKYFIDRGDSLER